MGPMHNISWGYGQRPGFFEVAGVAERLLGRWMAGRADVIKGTRRSTFGLEGYLNIPYLPPLEAYKYVCEKYGDDAVGN